MLFFVEAADMLVERYECMATPETLAVSQGFLYCGGIHIGLSGDSKGKSMLSVSECAQILGVSTARVRQLIASGSLEATKVGRSWVLPEAAVYDRLLKNPSSRRPSSSSDDLHSERMASSAESRCDLPRLFEECKKAFSFCVPLDVLQSAKTQEEADFYIELSDFFLRQKQRELVKRGAF